MMMGPQTRRRLNRAQRIARARGWMAMKRVRYPGNLGCSIPPGFGSASPSSVQSAPVRRATTESGGLLRRLMRLMGGRA